MKVMQADASFRKDKLLIVVVGRLTVVKRMRDKLSDSSFRRATTVNQLSFNYFHYCQIVERIKEKLADSSCRMTDSS